jgi:hypothetical protein
VREFSFIHAAEDVPYVLSVAADAGLIIRDGRPTSRPGPIIIDRPRFSNESRGQFVGYRDDWIYGEFPIHEIEAGAYKGKYDISPGTNAVYIELYFMGERNVEAGQRLGNGDVSRRIDWYDPAAHAVYSAPPEVKEVFDAIRKRLDTRKRVRAGGRTYCLLEGALKKIKKGYLPPFDFIEWPAELL